MGLFHFKNYLSRSTDDKLLYERYNIDINAARRELHSIPDINAQDILNYTMKLISEKYYPTIKIVFEIGEVLINKEYINKMISSDIIARSLLHYAHTPNIFEEVPFDESVYYRDLSKIYPRPDGKTFKYDCSYTLERERILRQVLGIYTYNSTDLSKHPKDVKLYKAKHQTNFAFMNKNNDNKWLFINDEGHAEPVKKFNAKQKYVITSPYPDLIKAILKYIKSFPLLAQESVAQSFRHNLRFYSKVFKELDPEITCEKIYFLERITNINLLNNYANALQAGLKHTFNENVFLDLCLLPNVITRNNLINIFSNPLRPISSIMISDHEYKDSKSIERIFLDLIKTISTDSFPLFLYTFIRLVEGHIMDTHYLANDWNDIEERSHRIGLDSKSLIELENDSPRCASLCSDFIKKSSLHSKAMCDTKNFKSNFESQIALYSRRVNDTGQRLSRLIHPAFRDYSSLITILHQADTSIFSTYHGPPFYYLWDRFMWPHFEDYMTK